MDIEVALLLAVPVAFTLVALGWFAARVDIKHLLESSRALPKSYFRGLNHLLNEQPDRAIDSFIDAVRSDPETVELHFTLGAMFRRRGETERAIRLHQSLLARADLSEPDRAKAEHEIGLDYLKAGMLDRAEQSFSIVRRTSLRELALTALLELYEIEKEWMKAIEIARELEAASGDDQRARIAHYWCEIAQQALARSALEEAAQALAHAREAHRGSLRAIVIEGELCAARGHSRAAIDTWLALEKHGPLHLALVADRIAKAYRALGEPAEGLTLLRSLLVLAPSVDLLSVVHREALALQGAQAAHDIVVEEVRRAPTLLGIDKLVESRLALAPPQIVPELELVKASLAEQTRRLSRYTCTRCGFKARQFYWQCPGCRHWDTYVPRKTEELEAIQ